MKIKQNGVTSISGDEGSQTRASEEIHTNMKTYMILYPTAAPNSVEAPRRENITRNSQFHFTFGSLASFNLLLFLFFCTLRSNALGLLKIFFVFFPFPLCLSAPFLRSCCGRLLFHLKYKKRNIMYLMQCNCGNNTNHNDNNKKSKQI